MAITVVANPKGGVGKSTLSTNLAGYLARCGHTTALGDVDPQQSSRLWLDLRPAAARQIGRWPVHAESLVRPPRGVAHAVLDTPAGLQGELLAGVLRLADQVLIPLQPSIFDIYATRHFLDSLAASRRMGKVRVGIVGMRVDERTVAAEKLQAFVQGLGLPVVGFLRDTQNYVHLAAQGLSLFDVAPARVEKDLQQWRAIADWLAA